SDDFLIIVCNFTPVARYHYRIGVPRGGRYTELLNSDKDVYWGSNVCNEDDLFAHDIPSHGHGHCLDLTIPPLSTIILKPS
ncbi:MAG: alpha amylase C-terminal domain-containing protein, partial [Desulfobulbaceae bacterium]|nr:alpha amylase C-terminal domain-containing protein [Desulfobulbaceae bacterium]